MSAARYDAFISYCRADTALARELHRGLRKLGKAWNQRAAVTVFRDEDELGGGGLWNAIDEALIGSSWFVLLASPESAGRPWVQRELERWLELGRKERLIIVLCRGTIAWDATAGDFDWSATDALPHQLSGELGEEPRWVDARALAAGSNVRLAATPGGWDLVAEVAAPIHGVSKSEILGEDARQVRRSRRWVRGGVSALAALLAVAIALALVAERQRGTANEQRARAEQELQSATSRLLALRAQDLQQSDAVASLLTVASAYRTDPGPESLEAMSTILDRTTNLVGVARSESGKLTALVAGASSSVAFSGSEQGEVVRWTVDPILGRVAADATVVAFPGIAVVGLALSADGSDLLVVGGDGRIAVLPGTTAEWAADDVLLLTDPLAGGAIESVTVAAHPVRDLFLVVANPKSASDCSEAPPAVVRLADTARGGSVLPLRTSVRCVTEAAFVGNDRFDLLEHVTRNRFALNGQPVAVPSSEPSLLTAIGTKSVTFSPDGTHYLSFLPRFFGQFVAPGPVEESADFPFNEMEGSYSRDNLQFVAVGDGQALIWSPGDVSARPLRIVGVRRLPTAVAALGGSHFVVAHGAELSAWSAQADRVPASRLPLPIKHDQPATAGADPGAWVVANGNIVAWQSQLGNNDDYSVRDVARPVARRTTPVAPLGTPVAVLDSGEIFVEEYDGSQTFIERRDSGGRGLAPVIFLKDGLSGSENSVAGEHVAVVLGGQVVVLDMNSGSEQILPFWKREASDPLVKAIAPSGDLVLAQHGDGLVIARPAGPEGLPATLSATALNEGIATAHLRDDGTGYLLLETGVLMDLRGAVLADDRWLSDESFTFAVSSDGGLVAASVRSERDGEETERVIEVRAVPSLALVSRHRFRVSGNNSFRMAFGGVPGGEFLVAASAGGAVAGWPVGPSQITQRLCALVGAATANADLASNWEEPASPPCKELEPRG